MKENEFTKVYDIKGLLGRQSFTSHGRRASEATFSSQNERYKTALGLHFPTFPILRQTSTNKSPENRLTVRFETKSDENITSGKDRNSARIKRGRSLSIKSDSILLKRSDSFKSGLPSHLRRGSIRSTSHISRRRGSSYIHTYSNQSSGVFNDVNEVNSSSKAKTERENKGTIRQ